MKVYAGISGLKSKASADLRGLEQLLALEALHGVVLVPACHAHRRAVVRIEQNAIGGQRALAVSAHPAAAAE